MDQLGSDMLVDSEFDEKQDVAIISPDDPESMEDVEADTFPAADDYEAMKEKYFPELPDQEIEDEAVFDWEITKWDNQNMNRREHSPVFQCAGHPWRILFFPFGNNVEFASFYLEQGFEDKPPEDWYACVQFLLVLWNPNDPTMHVVHNATHRFTADEGDWGFTRFAELRKLFGRQWEDRPRPMVENNSCKMTAYVRVLKDPTGVLWHNFINYDSKKETGLVGLRNQGATCYLNSLLQSLYFTNAFRKAIYQIPTEEETDRSNSAYALQRLFYQLQTNTAAVPTTELTHSFGWDSKQIFEQQDVQELSRILMERMEEKMKGTEAQDALSKMFLGKMKTYISCIDVPYESSRIEDFWDIQLNVSGNKNLDDSFKDYIQVETMDGENKYFAEGHGLQDAKKGVIFESFPQVLHLQLKRFEYDINRDAMMKVNDRYEFPEVWDASPYLSGSADRSESYVYHLHGVLVHSGDLNAGHYYAFLKPKKNGDFYKFDDDRVTRATKREAMEENFGGDYSQANGSLQQRNPYTRTWSAKRSMSAYMLVYIRESRLDNILIPDQEVEAPPHLAQRIEEERALAEKRRKDREEAHLYMEVQVATESNFVANHTFDVVPWSKDQTSAPYPKSYRILRAMTVIEFTKFVAEELGLDAALLRPWAMVNRQNGTVRPDQPIGIASLTIEEAANKYGTKTSNFRIWIEQATEKDAEGSAVFGDSRVDLKQNVPDKPLMLFLKAFDAEKQIIHGIGTLYAALYGKIQDVSPQILDLMKWPAGTSFKLWEEIRQDMVEPIQPKATFQQSELQVGDIITVEKSLTEQESQALSSSGKYTSAKEFYNYLVNRCEVTFIPKAGSEDETATFTLTLSKQMKYDQFSAKAGAHLGVEPSHLRFTTINAHTGKPKNQLRFGLKDSLQEVLFPQASRGYGSSITAPKSDQLLYEVLDIPLKELEQRKPLKIRWLPEGISKEEIYEILVPKEGGVEDILAALQKKANIPEDVIEHCRVFETHQNKFYNELPLANKNSNSSGLNEYFNYYVEKKPEDELADPDAKFILAFHFDKEPGKPHSTPFKFVLKEGETFKDTKERLSKRTGIKGKNFEKIKFALVGRAAFMKPEYLQDDDILTDRIRDIGDRVEVSLGLDHADKKRSLWSKAESIHIR